MSLKPPQKSDKDKQDEGPTGSSEFAEKMSRMNEISGKVRRWVHTALMVYRARARRP